MIGRGLSALLIACSACLGPAVFAAEPTVPVRPPDAIRVATFNMALSRDGAGVLLKDFAAGDAQIGAVAEIVRLVRPDVLLINEIDHDPQGLMLDALRALLARDGRTGTAIDYAHAFTAPVNTGVPSGMDLDGDGRVAGPRDAFGFGRFPGQYGMALLSRLPLGETRTFRLFPWAALPGARRPVHPDGTPFHTDRVWERLRLSSKSHWDIVVVLPDGDPVHLLASHPTPPVFDGPEDLNGRRNADEIAFWIGHVDGADWVVDDTGRRGGLAPDAPFIVLGDLNADPDKGDSLDDSIAPLLNHPRITDPAPERPGGHADGETPPGARHTAHWPGPKGPGNLRVDYVLPSTEFVVLGSGVFWPARSDPLSRLVAHGRRGHVSSDHRLVWVDIRLRKARHER